MRNIIAKGSELGMPMRPRKMADGRWVKTMVLILPKRLAMLEARIIDAAAMMEVVKNREPRRPSSRPNLRLKNQVTQDLKN